MLLLLLVELFEAAVALIELHETMRVPAVGGELGEKSLRYGRLTVWHLVDFLAILEGEKVRQRVEFELSVNTLGALHVEKGHVDGVILERERLDQLPFPFEKTDSFQKSPNTIN